MSEAEWIEFDLIAKIMKMYKTHFILLVLDGLQVCFYFHSNNLFRIGVF